jgi:hypothetical protein
MHFSWNKLFAVHHLFGIGLFVIASRLQLKTHQALANLRMNDKSTADFIRFQSPSIVSSCNRYFFYLFFATGEVVSYGHKIPCGGMFNYVSSPHYFAEILIYLSINIIFAGQSTTWWLVCLFVAVNQILMGLVNHQWYKKQFTHYPITRKAVLPFVL